MKDISIFFCDVYGTVSFNDISVNERLKNVQSFIKNLKILKQIDNSNEIIFSLITTEKFDIAKKYYFELLPELNNNNITMGPFYTEDRVLYSNGKVKHQGKMETKIEQINAYLKSIQETGKYNIKHIYYAEDSRINLLVVGSLINKKYSNIKYSSFSPSEYAKDNIAKTNDDIENYIKVNCKKR